LIDNEKTFQRLVNHLFSLECNSPGFIPSSPYIGADGAFDGDFSGYYPPEGTTGRWSIQSKWTTKSMGEAFRHLSKEVRLEVEKARKNGVDHLRIATNAQLKTAQVRSLEKLNAQTPVSLVVWHRERLNQWIESQPFLRYYFFGSPQFPKFVPWNIYFDEVGGLLPISTRTIASFDYYLEKAKQFLLSPRTILLIHSPGGYGKTHLMRQIASIAHQTNPFNQPWVIRFGPRSMSEAIQDELVAGRRYVLLLDEADAIADELRALFSLCKNNPSSVKVILSFRSSGLQKIYDVLNAVRVVEFSEEIRIKDWKPDDLIEVLRAAAGKDQVQDESVIVAQYPNPFILVWIGKRIAGQTAPSLDEIKKKLSSEFEAEVIQCLDRLLSQNATFEFLTNLAMIAPVSSTDKKLDPSLSKAMDLDPHTSGEALSRLFKAGILREVGNTLRFNPDMKGEVFLLRRLQEMDEAEIRRRVGKWISLYPVSLLRNLGATARYGGVAIVKRVLANFISTWILNPETAPIPSGRITLNAIQGVVQAVPEECLRLVRSYLELREPSEWIDRTLPLTTDDYGPVMAQLVQFPSLRSRVLETILSIHSKKIEGMYDNFKPDSLVRLCVSPLENGESSILETLSIFSKWLQGSKPPIELVCAGLSEVLGGSHEYNQPTIGGFVIGERVLSGTPQLLRIRDEALRLLENMVVDSSMKTRLAAIDCVSLMGFSRFRRIPEEKLPLSTRIAEERRRMTRRIGETIQPGMNLVPLHKIDQLFLTWWAQLTPGAEEAEKYLEEIQRTPEYLFFCHYISPHWIVEDFTALKKTAPVDGRWTWFVNTHGYREMIGPEGFEALVSELARKFTSPQDIVGFLRYLDSSLPTDSRQPVPPILTCWVRSQRGVFESIRREKHLWENTPARFKDEIQSALAENDQDSLHALANEVISELPGTPSSKVQAFLMAAIRYPFSATQSYLRIVGALGAGRSEIVFANLFSAMCYLWMAGIPRFSRDKRVTLFTLYKWLHLLVANASGEATSRIIMYLDPLSDKLRSVYLLVRLLRLAVSTEENYATLNFAVYVLLLRRGQAIQALHTSETRELRGDLLDRLLSLPSLGYEAQGVLSFACTDIETMIDFLNRRFSLARQKGASYDAIPFDGMPAVAKLTKSYDDFEKLMNAIMKWQDDAHIPRTDLSAILEPHEASEATKLRTHLEEFVGKRLDAHDVRAATKACELLDLREDNIDTLVRASNEGILSGLKHEVEAMLIQKTVPLHGWSGKMGEEPFDLVLRKAMFEKMREAASSELLIAILDNCAKDIEKLINLEMAADERILNPMG
jgi:hypothetical protein